MSALGSGVLQTMLPTLSSLVIQLPVEFCHLKLWSRDQKAGGTEKSPALVPTAVDTAGSWDFAVGEVGMGCPHSPWVVPAALEAPGGYRCKFWGWARSTGGILISAHHPFLFTPLAPSLPPLAPSVLISPLYIVPSHLKSITWFFS